MAVYKRKKKKVYQKKKCKFCINSVDGIDYKETGKLRKYVTERGKIIPRKITGNCGKHQRQMTNAIKRARIMALLPFTSE